MRRRSFIFCWAAAHLHQTGPAQLFEIVWPWSFGSLQLPPLLRRSRPCLSNKESKSNLCNESTSRDPISMDIQSYSFAMYTDRPFLETECEIGSSSSSRGLIWKWKSVEAAVISDRYSSKCPFKISYFLVLIFLQGCFTDTSFVQTNIL